MFMLMCTHMPVLVHDQRRLDGVQGVAEKGEASSSEVCYLFDVGEALLSVSAVNRPQYTHTSSTCH